ncbi:hypothetical protein DMX06_02780 [Pseudomonas mosselii]|nr:hypothetical protein DMX06_02780 [Pseudomonas mosselii]
MSRKGRKAPPVISKTPWVSLATTLQYAPLPAPPRTCLHGHQQQTTETRQTRRHQGQAEPHGAQRPGGQGQRR